MLATVLLVAYVSLVAVAAPAILTRAAWPLRSPRTAIAVWQALTISAVIAGVLAGLSLALSSVDPGMRLDGLVHACAHALQRAYEAPGGSGTVIAGLSISLLLSVRVGWSLVVGLRRGSVARRDHALALILVGHADPELGAWVVDHPVPAAYSLPGWHSRVVVTSSAIRELDGAQLAAVLQHERAHLRGRHHLVVAAADAFDNAIPHVPLFRQARSQLRGLVEMLADDAAVRAQSTKVLASALLVVAGGVAPLAALGAGGERMARRVGRLTDPVRGRLWASGGSAVLAGGSLLLPFVLVLVPALIAAAANGFNYTCPVSF